MARTPYSRDSYVGGAPQARLLADITDADTTITVVGTNAYWNTLGKSGANDAGFFLCLSIGSASEEKVFVPGGAYSWSSGSVTLTIVVRGQNGTPASSHSASDPVTPVMTATDLNEANYAVSQTVGKIAAQGDLLYGNGANEFAKLAAGTAGQFLKTNGAGAAPSWASTSGLWSGSTSYTVSGFSRYIVIADVTFTQAASAVTAGEYQLAAGGKTVYGFSASLANSRTTLTLTTVVTTSGTISAVATRNNGTGTAGTPNLTVIGLN